MDFYSFTKAGRQHQRSAQANQDQLFGIRGHDRIAVCLSDGAGFSPYGREAARRVATITARLFYDRFWQLMVEKPDAVRSELCAALLPALQDYAAQANIPPEWMAATLVALAMDDQGRYICAHLGDGSILEQGPEQSSRQFQVVSAPSNGLFLNSTFLTMNSNLMFHLKICRSTVSSQRKLLLMTDGADQLLRPKPDLRTLPCAFSGQEVEHFLDLLHPQDDYSAVELFVG